MCSPTDKDEEEDGNVFREGHRGSKEGYLVNVKGFTYNFMRLNTQSKYSERYTKILLTITRLSPFFSTHWLYYYPKW